MYGSITLALWYGGKLVHENYQDPKKGITPGILTGKTGFCNVVDIKDLPVQHQRADYNFIEAGSQWCGQCCNII